MLQKRHSLDLSTHAHCYRHGLPKAHLVMRLSRAVVDRRRRAAGRSEMPLRAPRAGRDNLSILIAALFSLACACVGCSSDDGTSYCQMSLPLGSYSRSCESCAMSGTTLRCLCNGPNGYQAASLDTCSCDTSINDLNNNQGVLQCGPGKGGGSSNNKGPKCKTSGESCSSSVECCGLCNMISSSTSYHECE